MEKGEGRDRVASDRRGCRGSCGDAAAPSHTRGGGATVASFYRLRHSRRWRGETGGEKNKGRKDKQGVWLCIKSQDRFIFPPWWATVPKCKWQRCLRGQTDGHPHHSSASPILPREPLPCPDPLWQQAGREMETRKARTSISPSPSRAAATTSRASTTHGRQSEAQESWWHREMQGIWEKDSLSCTRPPKKACKASAGQKWRQAWAWSTFHQAAGLQLEVLHLHLPKTASLQDHKDLPSLAVDSLADSLLMFPPGLKQSKFFPLNHPAVGHLLQRRCNS